MNGRKSERWSGLSPDLPTATAFIGTIVKTLTARRLELALIIRFWQASS